MTGESLLREKLRLFSVSRNDGLAQPAEEILVVAQPGDSLDAAFRLARARLDQHLAVRLVGPGVTLPRTWPSWVKDASGLTLTEWGAFRPIRERDATASLLDDVRGWIHAVFGGAFGDQPPERLFFAAACQRFLQPLVKAYPIARAIASAFPGARAACVRGEGATEVLLRQFLTATGGSVEGEASARSPRVPWRARLLGLGVLGLAASVARTTKAYVDGAPTRREIEALRRREAVPTPSAWVALLPDWFRMNHQLLDGFAFPETDGGGGLGVLFIGTLAPFERDEAQPFRHRASELWPGLGKLRDRLSQVTVEQAVMPEEPLEYAIAAARGAARSARLLWRLSAAKQIALPSAEFSPAPLDLVRWATIDVLRATLSEAAARSLLARESVSGRSYLFIGSNNVTWSPVDRALRDAGATTVDHPHGWSPDVWSATFDSEASVRLLWTLPDVASAALPGETVAVAGMPVRVDLPPRTRRARRILLMTNYTYASSEADVGFPGGDNPLPWSVFQSEVVDTLRLVRERHPDVELRWRPHPADDARGVAADSARGEHLPVSRGVPLDDDLAWADIIVSTMSTVALESMFAGTPVFVQVLPDLWGLPASGFLDPLRIFFYSQDGARLISAWIDEYADRPATGLGPEARARVALFGPDGLPVPMTDYFGRSAARSAVVTPGP